MRLVEAAGLKFFKLAVFLFLLLPTLSSSATTLSPEKRRFEHFTTVDGLSQNTVYAISQDRFGFMWFGTVVGLNRFDGYSFKVYHHDENNPNSLSANEVSAIFEDTEGRLWIGTRGGGLSRFDQQTEQFFSYSFKEIHNGTYEVKTVNCMYEHQDRLLLVGTIHGLAYYDSEKDVLVGDSDPILGEKAVQSISASSQPGLVWVGTKQGLFLLDVESKSVVKHFLHKEGDSGSISENYVTSVVEDAKGRVWVGTRENGLHRLSSWKDNRFEHFTAGAAYDGQLLSNTIRTLSMARDQSIWVGTRLGLEQLVPSQQGLDKPVFTHFTKNMGNKNSMNHNSIYSFYEDQLGDYWIGTYSGGVNFSSNTSQKFGHYSHQPSNSQSLSDQITTAFEFEGEDVWVGTMSGGLNLWKRKQGVFEPFEIQGFKSSGGEVAHVKTLEMDNDKKLWVGTAQGLFYYNRSDQAFEPLGQQAEIITLEATSNAEMWVGTSKGVRVYDKSYRLIGEYKHHSTDDHSLSGSSVKKILQLSNGDVWVGTREGLNYFVKEKKHFVQYLHQQGDTSSLSNSYVTTMSEDLHGNLWVGTFNGLNRYVPESKSFIRYKTEAGLSQGVILNIAFDDSGYLWLTTDTELIKCDPSRTFSEGFIIRRYDSRDGLQRGAFRINTMKKNDNGELFVGGSEGFNLFNPNEIQHNPNEPRVAIIDLKINNTALVVGAAESPLDRPINQKTSITLQHDQDFVTFSFVALSYVSSSKNQYAYKLDGLDADWNYVGQQREARYTNIPPGRYHFLVKASNNDGVWSSEGTSLEVVVLPPWWGTWWFRLLLVVILLGVSVFVPRVRIQLLKANQEKLRQKVDEKTSDLQIVNNKLWTQQQELESSFKNLKNAQSQLVQSEKMASIGVLTAGLAHEINNPLNFIQGSKAIIASYIDKQLGADHRKELDPFLDSLQDGLDRITTILSSIGKFSFTHAQYDDVFNLNDIIDNCLVMLNANFRGRITVHRDFAKDIDDIEGNQGEFHQLMLNVISNAEQSIPKKGVVRIKTYQKLQQVCVEISDTGCGISEENLEKVTDPFFTTKDPGMGVGLGMSIALAIVNRHSGHLSITSKIEEGTTVFLSFPVKSLVS